MSGLDFEAATRGPEFDRWLDRDALNAQHRALCDAAVAQARAEERGWHIGRYEELEQSYLGLLAAVAEWRAAQKEDRACDKYRGESSPPSQRTITAEAALLSFPLPRTE